MSPKSLSLPSCLGNGLGGARKGMWIGIEGRWERVSGKSNQNTLYTCVKLTKININKENNKLFKYEQIQGKDTK